MLCGADYYQAAENPMEKVKGPQIFGPPPSFFLHDTNPIN